MTSVFLLYLSFTIFISSIFRWIISFALLIYSYLWPDSFILHKLCNITVSSAVYLTVFLRSLLSCELSPIKCWAWFWSLWNFSSTFNLNISYKLLIYMYYVLPLFFDRLKLVVVFRVAFGYFDIRSLRQFWRRLRLSSCSVFPFGWIKVE